MFKGQNQGFTVNGKILTVFIGQLFSQDDVPGKYMVLVYPDRTVPVEERSSDRMETAEKLVGIFDTLEQAMEAYKKECAELEQREKK